MSIHRPFNSTGAKAAIIVLMLGALVFSAYEIWSSAVGNSSDWKQGGDGLLDIATYGAIFVGAALIFRLSNKEIRTSQDHSRDAERSLEDERDALERRISERTTALVAAEEEKRRELERTAAFGKISQGLFHDLMGPLTSISLQLEQLGSKEHSQTETRDMVQKTVEMSQRMRSFMDSIKKWKGPEDISNTNEADMGKELSVVCDMLAYKARMADVRIWIRCPENVTIKARPVRIQQLLLNLISNSIEAFGADRSHSQGERHIDITVHDEGGKIRLSIKDNGCGIPAEHVDKLGRNAFTTKANGSGTGLMTVASILKELGGTMKAESIEGKGTEFKITLP